MEFTAKQISSLINGKIEGDPVVTVSSFGKLEERRARATCISCQSQIRRISCTPQKRL